MKVLMVSIVFPLAGEATCSFVFNEALGLSSRGVRIHVARGVMRIRDGKRDLFLDGMHIHNFSRRIDASIIPLRARALVKSVAELPSTSFLHPKTVAATLPYSWFIAKLVKMYEIDLIHAHFAYPGGFAALLAKNMVKKPLIISIWGYDVQSDPKGGYGALSRKYTREMVSKALNGADAIIVGDYFHRETVVRLIGKDKARKIFFIPPAIDVSHFNPSVDGSSVRKKYGIAPNQTVVLFARHLRPIYGAEYLIKAASKVVADHPEAVFLMLGVGPLRPSLEELVRQLQLDRNVIFAGYVNRAQMPSYYATSEIFCDPCIFGQGLSSLEALACGKPVVGFKTRQIKIVDGTNGFLVEPSNVEELADKIMWLIEHSYARRKMGIKGRERVEKKHDPKDRVTEILKIYDEFSM